MAAILISVNDIKYLKTWFAIKEEFICSSTAIRDKQYIASLTRTAVRLIFLCLLRAIWGL